MALLLIDRYKGNKAAFEAKVIDMSKKLSIKPEWLMFVMNGESGLNPQAQNLTHLVQGKPATGLIQFIKSTADRLGTSIEALYKMDGVQQLDYVYKYLKPLTGKMKTFYDVYLAVFFPIAIGQPDNFVFKTKTVSADTIAKANPIFDYYKNGIITLAGFKRALFDRIPEKFKIDLFGSSGSPGISNRVKGITTVALLAALLLYFKTQQNV